MNINIEGKIIGNPKVFAIEFTVEFVRAETVYGNCRIWIEGKSLGDICESVYLGIFSSEVGRIPNLYYRKQREYEELKWTKKDKYYEKMKDVFDEIPQISNLPIDFIKSFEEDKLASAFSYESFDKFYITYYWKGPEIIFYWCLAPDIATDLKRYPQFKDYPKEVQRAEVSIEIMKQVTDEFEAKIKELIAGNKVKN
jgi:hypothetical protein